MAARNTGPSDGQEVYLRSWADRDSTTKVVTGESAAYFVRSDGRIVLADPKPTSDQMDKVPDDGQVDDVRAWLASYEDALAAAVIDSSVTG